MKVYVVTDGMYSDYHIVAIFSKREKAEAFKELCPNESENEIEEYELNDKVINRIQRGYQSYLVRMLRNGDSAVFSESAGGFVEGYDLPISFHASLMCRVWAKDEKHAVKIANEWRMRVIAEDKWPGVVWKLDYGWYCGHDCHRMVQKAAPVEKIGKNGYMRFFYVCEDCYPKFLEEVGEA